MSKGIGKIAALNLITNCSHPYSESRKTRLSSRKTSGWAMERLDTAWNTASLDSNLGTPSLQPSKANQRDFQSRRKKWSTWGLAWNALLGFRREPLIATMRSSLRSFRNLKIQSQPSFQKKSLWRSTLNLREALIPSSFAEALTLFRTRFQSR